MRVGIPASKTKFRWKIAPFDGLCVVVAPFIALALRDPSLFQDHAYYSYLYVIVTVACSLVVVIVFRLGDGMTRFFSVHDIWAVIGACLASTASSSVTLFVVDRLEGVPRSTPLIYGLVLGSCLLAGRGSARFFDTEHRPRRDSETPTHPRRVVLVGIDAFAAAVIKLTNCQEPRTTQIVSALDRRDHLNGRTISGVPIVGKLEDLGAVVDEYSVHGIEIDEIWLVDKKLSAVDLSRLEAECNPRELKLVPIARALSLEQLQPAVSRQFVVERPKTYPGAGYFRFKRFVDASTSAVLLLALSPVALLVAVATRLDVGAPVIFWQQRIGRSGRIFVLYKFRTYRAPFDRKGAPVESERRISSLGRLIRATRLDEIPQLLNILGGDMSLIGPRPLLPEDQPRDPTTRLSVRPGVTGWAQVNGGTLVRPEEKDALDAWYILNASILLDLLICWRTAMVVLKGERRDPVAIAAALGYRKTSQEIDERLSVETPRVRSHASRQGSLVRP